MKFSKFYVGLVSSFLFIGVAQAKFVVLQDRVVCAGANQKHDIDASLKWSHDAQEKTASYNMVYSVASDYVSRWVETNHPKVGTWGVILDIDETSLDNSWYQYACGNNTISSEDDFSHYVVIPHKAVAEPGAAKFTALVHQLGGYVSLVSNRDGSYKDNSGSVMEATITNVNSQKIYFDQVLLANTRDSKHPYNKNPRFDAVNNGKYDSIQMTWSNKLPAHTVIAYFGDSIGDFPGLSNDIVSKLDNNDERIKKFGRGYFILPNPMEGWWIKSKK